MVLQADRVAVNQAAGVEYKLQLTSAELAAVLIVYCKSRSIPIPAGSTKAIQNFSGQIALTITSNTNNKESLDRLLQKAGNLSDCETNSIDKQDQSTADLARRLGGLLKKRGETIAFLETTSSGMASATMQLSPETGTSCLGSVVVHSERCSNILLAITAKDLAWMQTSPAVYATLLARKTREHFGASWGVVQMIEGEFFVPRAGYRADRSWIAVSGPEEIVRETDKAPKEPFAQMLHYARTLLGVVPSTLEASSQHVKNIAS
nr:CinA family protein [Pararoseomonas baculiformis]